MTTKRLLGVEIAKLVKGDQVIGLGTGSTAEEAITAIGERIKSQGLTVYGVPTSNRCEELAMSVGIKILRHAELVSASPPKENETLKRVQGDKMSIDWGFDGADEVERGTLNILKGGGGAMTREKLVAKKCGRWIVLIDESKLVDHLGEKFPIPVEVQEEQMGRLIENLYEKYQPIDISVRNIIHAGPVGSSPPASAHPPVADSALSGPLPSATRTDQILLTDFGNPVIDVKIVPGSIKPQWEDEWERMPGVVGTGLFLGGYPDEVWIGKESGEIEKLTGSGRR